MAMARVSPVLTYQDERYLVGDLISFFLKDNTDYFCAEIEKIDTENGTSTVYNDDTDESDVIRIEDMVD